MNLHCITKAENIIQYGDSIPHNVVIASFYWVEYISINTNQCGTYFFIANSAFENSSEKSGSNLKRRDDVS